MEAYGPLDYGERLFARLDAGLAAISALIINRSGGIRHSTNPKMPGTPAEPRDFMWQPPPEPEATDAFLMELFGGKKAVKHGKKSRHANRRSRP